MSKNVDQEMKKLEKEISNYVYVKLLSDELIPWKDDNYTNTRDKTASIVSNVLLPNEVKSRKVNK